ncbi:phospho-sugar mutase [Microlunatus parietis]|uniref:Phosphomannomutase n=1 Tax=Microlunatus parietis TaxID=682979 RepID=A0A7Y9IBY0_9ACTN|nr:phospho-sugar mutase [Microlunatus parietis]NYE73776.1 phosphomannomutase [Microlunatus parietis]
MTGASAFDPALRERLDSWRAQDPDPATSVALDDLIEKAEAGDAAARAELTDAFTGRLEFGTAGLRGALGPGPNRMNRVVVTRAAAGLANYLNDEGKAGGRVIIGYDARYNSDVFARDSAEIIAAAGFEVIITAGPTPTPVVAFGIRHFDCVAGVVVTASHNPPNDNGYKVYLGDGSQIIPPADVEIAERIGWMSRLPLADLRRSEDYTVIGEELINAYLDRLTTLVDADAPRRLNWVYTPMHGVGGDIVRQAWHRTGFPAPTVVAEQEHPDPAFPTVSFPNPEEPGALDRAVATATTAGAELIIANDPDADRCAVAIPGPDGWRTLSGDELGAILGDDALRRGLRGSYACSIVSSSLLSAMAAAHGQRFVATLTGFKWIGRVPSLAFGYEEAIGYCCDPAAVPDKDGISALVRILSVAAGLKADGLTLADRLDELALRYGVHQTRPLTFRVSDLSLITDAMTRLREQRPDRLAGEPVAFLDLAEGTKELPATDGVRLCGDSIKVVVRPSGTEPKLKCYLEVRLPPAESQDLAAARARADRTLDQVGLDLTAVLGL